MSGLFQQRSLAFAAAVVGDGVFGPADGAAEIWRPGFVVKLVWEGEARMVSEAVAHVEIFVSLKGRA